MLKHIIRGLQILGSILIFLVVSGTIYQQVASVQSERAYPPVGTLIDVGGHQLHLHCIGVGEPTLVIDTGAADWSLSWLALHDDLAQITRTCLYDRAGLGWSEASNTPRTSNQLVEELHTLLANSGENAPYILMGHSLGGYNARIYYDRYPEDVVGIILLESAHPDQWAQLPREIEDLVTQQASLLNTMATLSHIGLVRFILPDHVYHDEDLQAIYHAQMTTARHLRASASELGGGIESATQVPDTDLDALPLVVVTAGRSFDAFSEFGDSLPIAEAEIVWQQLQVELSLLSINSVHLISPNASHNITFTDPDIVIEGVEAMMRLLQSS